MVLQKDTEPALVRVITEQNEENMEEKLTVEVKGQPLYLSCILKEDELAPLFSGAAWAGTVLWDAAIYLMEHVLTKFDSQFKNTSNGLSIIELGAGIGVPGMAVRIAGAKHVVITEQDDLLELMHRNISNNIAPLKMQNTSSDAFDGIFARELSWGVNQSYEYFKKYPSEKFDLVLSCDCIYEPLYGESWRLLAQTMEIICTESEKRSTIDGIIQNKCLVIMAVERRNQDGVDHFLSYVDTSTNLSYDLHESRIAKSSTRILELYYLRLKR